MADGALVRMEIWIPEDIDRQITEQLETGVWASRAELVRTALREWFAAAVKA